MFVRAVTFLIPRWRSLRMKKEFSDSSTFLFWQTLPILLIVEGIVFVFDISISSTAIGWQCVARLDRSSIV
jgi:hypothetical protein